MQTSNGRWPNQAPVESGATSTLSLQPLCRRGPIRSALLGLIIGHERRAVDALDRPCRLVLLRGAKTRGRASKCGHRADDQCDQDELVILSRDADHDERHHQDEHHRCDHPTIAHRAHVTGPLTRKVPIAVKLAMTTSSVPRAIIAPLYVRVACLCAGRPFMGDIKQTLKYP